jgi:hypothetical protein
MAYFGRQIMTTTVNLSRGMKIMVKSKGLYRDAVWDWFPGIVERVEIEDGEEYVIGHLIKPDWDDDPKFRVHRDDVRPFT